MAAPFNLTLAVAVLVAVDAALIVVLAVTATLHLVHERAAALALDIACVVLDALRALTTAVVPLEASPIVV